MLVHTKQMLSGLLGFGESLASTVNPSEHNQQCMIEPIIINLHPNEYTQGLSHYSYVVNLDRCMGSCNTLYGLSNRICVLNKTENLNLNAFNMITEISESSQISTKNISREHKCKFDGVKYNSNQKRNNDKCRRYCKISKEHHVLRKK